MTKKVLLFLVIAIIIVAGVWFWNNRDRFLSRPSAPSAATSSATSLGSQIYAKTTNPLNNVSTATTPTVPNPVQGLYKNPFQ